MSVRNREYRFSEDSPCKLFLRGGNQLSGKDPRGADEIASVGFFTGAGNVIYFVGPWAEAEERYEVELEEALARVAAS